MTRAKRLLLGAAVAGLSALGSLPANAFWGGWNPFNWFDDGWGSPWGWGGYPWYGGGYPWYGGYPYGGYGYPYGGYPPPYGGYAYPYGGYGYPYGGYAYPYAWVAPAYAVPGTPAPSAASPATQTK
jgi:hypothetical protein